LNLVGLLGHLEFTDFPHELDNRVTGNSGQDCSIKGRSNQLVIALFILPEDEEVHSAHLSDVVMDKPESLITAMIFTTNAAGLERRRVITKS
jgi:hypothetical protein